MDFLVFRLEAKYVLYTPFGNRTKGCNCPDKGKQWLTGQKSCTVSGLLSG